MCIAQTTEWRYIHKVIASLHHKVGEVVSRSITEDDNQKSSINIMTQCEFIP